MAILEGAISQMISRRGQRQRSRFERQGQAGALALGCVMHAARMPTDLQIEAFGRFMAQHRAAVLADAELCQGLLRISGRRDQGPQAAAVAWDAQVGNAIAALKMIESSLPAEDSIDGGDLGSRRRAGTAARLAAATGPADHLA